MRIAYICCDPGIPVFGTKGASVHIQEVVRELRSIGHEVALYAVRSGKHIPDDLTDLELHLEAVADVEPAEREQAQAHAAERIVSRVIADGADLVYERYSLFSTALADITAATGVPGILEVNAPLIDEQRRHRSLVDASGAAQVLRRQVTAARATVCVSNPVADWVRRRTADLFDIGAGDVAGRIHTVPNGVSVRRIQPQPEDPDRVVVTFVGTLKPWHGVADLITAAALARQSWSLRIIGDGPEMDSLRAQAGRLGVEADFRGAVAPQDIPIHLAGSAIGVAPYPDLGGGEQQYFSPMKVLEYLAAGLAVVASDVGQIPQLLEDGSGRHGVLVAPSDPTALAAALDDLATCPGRRVRMGRSGRLLAEQRHSWRRTVDRILELTGLVQGGER
ncbi:glycosyltransferase, group 1 family protein [Actinomyces johnsonii F0510]|uniref:Glycosyltransferase, group 1 family protein n=1 Tax=Actinomyces johnsonii F0510 TaxID=1227262 RepID=U1PZX3_9ACTO|nr:glycosyltransferase family 4 protein [Actinomyces johnsonii]ERH15901.1 glycosyltransferase, group 1 family protein [Actinomyces johnsonii F0510]